MANETTVTVVGALGGDPELRFTPSGAAVCNFSVGTNARTFDKQTDEWKDGPTTWLSCSAWRELAENCAESLQKGTRVIIQGHLTTREYERRDGSKGLSVDLNVQSIGPDLRWATARVTRAGRSGGGDQSRGSSGGGQRDQGQGGGQQAGNDPWGGGGQQGSGNDPWGAPNRSDDPPF